MQQIYQQTAINYCQRKIIDSELSYLFFIIKQLTMSFLRIFDKQNQTKNLKSRPTKYQDMFIYTLIDKCTQILRQDRVLIRNKIKQGDKDVTALFSNLKKPINMHLLQINIRKYLTQSRILPLKQNFHAAYKLNKENLIRKQIDPPKSLQKIMYQSKSPPQKDMKSSLTHQKVRATQQKEINRAQNNRRTLSQSNNTIKFPEKDNYIQSRKRNESFVQNSIIYSDLYQLERNLQKAEKQTLLIFDSISKKINNPHENKISDCKITQSIITTHDGIFTSPELLMECRRFLQQSKTQNWRNDRSNFSSKLENSHYQSNIKSSNVQNVHKIKIEQDNKCKFVLMNEQESSLEKEVKLTKLEFKCNKLQFEESKQLKITKIKKSFKQYSSQQAFQLFFQKNSSFQLDWQNFDQIILQNFQLSEHQFIQQLFLKFRSTQNKINAIQLGKCLDKQLTRKHTNIEYIYNLIDIQQHGNFTQQEFERFLSQIMQIQSSNFDEIKITAAKIFKAADLQKNKKISYWGLYFIKDIPEILSFAEYLEQFQFQVEM